MKSSHLQPFDNLSRDEIAATLDKLSQASVAVLGDFCLDIYWTIDRSASETSLETGLRTEPVRSQRYSPGGAGNVVMNLQALGVREIYPIGLLGADPFGRELIRLLESPHIHAEGLLIQEGDWATHAYLKPYVDGQELSRMDHGNFNRLSEESTEALLARLGGILDKVSVVLVNHQVAGSIHDSEGFRARLARVIEANPQVCFIVDSRGYHEAYQSAVHKLNDREVLRACGEEVGADDLVGLEDLVSHTAQLYERWKAPLVVTRGSRGCLVFTGGMARQIFGIQLPGRSDPVGAGDTFVSTLAAITSTGPNLVAAAYVANIAAAVTAQKLFQTGTATDSEILEMGTSPDYAFHPELAEAPYRARYLESSEIELISDPPGSLAIRHAIFDHDGTLSTLREGWERIMEPMMIKAVLGRQHATADEVVFHRVQARVHELIERTTGIQTITQMHGLAELVREFGFVPEREVLHPSEYKAIYNQELKALVDLRLAKLQGGELEISDFTLKGAVPFIRALQKAGVRIYLASGTDEADVRIEAERLGYADVFDGGIYGSVGLVARDAKRVVIERIMAEVEGAFDCLVTFGDGPVEMRETIRRGAFAVGVASDELRRFGLNLEKRARLVRAGAQAIVPDFSQWPQLWSLLRLPTQ